MKIAIDVHSIGTQAGGNETYFRQLLRGLVLDKSDQEYVLFYTPANQVKAGKKREIKVKLVSADGRLYHKQGYVY